jgi:predicted nucleic acid-binding protein
MDILADTGILLRFMEPSDPACQLVQNAIQLLRSRGDRVMFAPQNAAEFWNVSTRPTTARGGMGLSLPETHRRLSVIEIAFPMLFDLNSAYAIWRSLVVAYSVKGKQVHDARLVAQMQAHGITHILTLNVADFARYPGITVLDPATIALPPTQ